MDIDSVGLIIFAFTALAAVLSFIFVLGGPEDTTGMGQIHPDDACNTQYACDGGAQWTGREDPSGELYECQCNNNELMFFASKYE